MNSHSELKGFVQALREMGSEKCRSGMDKV